MKKIAIFLSLIISVSATQLKVPSAYSTIQAAIDAATTGDTVLVADGTYTENLSIDKDIKIISENGAEKTIIDGGKITHVIGIGSSTTRDCVLDGFTVTNGGGDDAGGIFVAGGSPKLRNLIITGNRCEKWSGGGIDVIGEGANPLIEDCIITDNYATDSGGGLMVAQKATATINDVTISNNTAGGNGGGINVWEGSIKIKNAILENNSANYRVAMSVGTGDIKNFKPIIDIENVEIINQRDSTTNAMVSFDDCSLTVKNLSFSNIRTKSNLGSFNNSIVNIENLSLKDIRDNGHSLLFIGSKGTVSGMTIERDTSRWAIAKIEKGSKIDFNNLKISNSKTSDFSGLFIDDATVTIDTLDINNCNWESHSIRVNKSIFTLSNGNISSIISENGNAGIDASESSSVEISNTTINSSSSGAHAMKFINVDKVSITNSSFNGNHSQYSGGVIFAEEIDSLLIESSSFVADTSGGEGGAIQLSSKNKFVRILKSTFSNNSSNSAGAINSWNTDSLFIDNSTFDGNIALEGNGGAINMSGDENSTLYCEIKNTTFDKNIGNWGGAIGGFEPIMLLLDNVVGTNNTAREGGGFSEYCCGASVKVNKSTFSNNLAKQGGAINGSKYTLEVVSSNIVDNVVTEKHGAGINYFEGNGLIITDSNISRNTGAELGSGLTIANTSKPVTINNVEFSDNKAGGGGAIYGWYTNEVSMKNVTFKNNTANQHEGGAILINGSGEDVVYIDSTTFIANVDSTGSGGAIQLSNIAKARIKKSVFFENDAKESGGAISLFEVDSLNISDTRIISNSSQNNCGAINIHESNVEILNSLISHNSSYSGTVYVRLNSKVKMENTVIDSNTASQFGGGIRIDSNGSVELKNVVIRDNMVTNSEGYGGGIDIWGGKLVADSLLLINNNSNAGEFTLSPVDTVIIKNSTLARNIARNGGLGLSVNDGYVNITNSIVWDNKFQISSENPKVTALYSIIEGGFTGTGNLDKNPMFCDTINYLIRDTSPCVGTGENGSNMGAKGIGCYAPSSFDWVSTALDTVNITQSNLADTYTLQWSGSTDEDGETIDYLLYAQIGVNPPEEIYDTTSTSVQITYQELVENVFEPFPMLPRATVKFSVSATDGIDTVNVTGDDRVLFVNRYEYLSTEGEGIPTEFALHENYPNPFNPTTTLRFDLPEVSDATITIYNMLGQKVKVFNMNDKPAGYHTIKWNATNDYGDPVGAGVYLYQLRAGTFVKTKKMVLLK